MNQGSCARIFPLFELVRVVPLEFLSSSFQVLTTVKAVFYGPFFEFVMALAALRCRKYDALLSINSFLPSFFGIIVQRNSFQGYTVTMRCVFAIPLDVRATHGCGYLLSDLIHLTGKQSIENFARKWITSG